MNKGLNKRAGMQMIPHFDSFILFLLLLFLNAGLFLFFRGEQDSLEDYLQLLLPMLLRLLERRDLGLDVRRVALAAILQLTDDSDYLLDSASRFGAKRLGGVRRGGGWGVGGLHRQ